MLVLAAASFVLAIADALAISYVVRHGLISRREQPAPTIWFATARERFRRQSTVGRPAAVVERVQAARGVLVHPCSYGGDLIEYPFHADFGEDAVLSTLAEIEAL